MQKETRSFSLKEQMEASVKRKEQERKRQTERKRKKAKPPTENELLKMEIARELGFEHQILEKGFGSLTARETGRIGGLMTARKKRKKEGIDIEGEEHRTSLP